MALLMKNGALLAHYFQGRLALTEDADICDCECGPPGCILGSDNFNRANSAVNEIGPKWEALAGEWRIHNNRLVCDDPGVLATTICHPLAYPLGAWWVNVKLTNLGTVGLYKIRAGHPTQSVYEVHFEVKGSGDKFLFYLRNFFRVIYSRDRALRRKGRTAAPIVAPPRMTRSPGCGATASGSRPDPGRRIPRIGGENRPGGMSRRRDDR